MPTLEDLAQRVEHLLVRHAELQRTQMLLQDQVSQLTAEREALRQRLNAARARVDGLLARLPVVSAAGAAGASPDSPARTEPEA